MLAIAFEKNPARFQLELVLATAAAQVMALARTLVLDLARGSKTEPLCHSFNGLHFHD